jgi:hypothetical protein
MQKCNHNAAARGSRERLRANKRRTRNNRYHSRERLGFMPGDMLLERI